MAPTVQDLILLFQLFFPSDLSLEAAFHLISIIFSLYPLLWLHHSQQREPRQPSQTAWMTSIWDTLFHFLAPAKDDLRALVPELDLTEEYTNKIVGDLDYLLQMFGSDPRDLTVDGEPPKFPASRIVLCTSRLSCIFCPVGDLNLHPTLRKQKKVGSRPDDPGLNPGHVRCIDTPPGRVGQNPSTRPTSDPTRPASDPIRPDPEQH
ncbi:unnamed protein product [Mycena citricolor]|uniref:Uncharacterized protein n=1 Tax=Mycena citricolor TaxID=2018698 RepID=A0AAD2K2R7_9AGAR|nr:unnamed protein product [Mycena citricolor]